LSCRIDFEAWDEHEEPTSRLVTVVARLALEPRYLKPVVIFSIKERMVKIYSENKATYR
jgi:hypothetical protein